MPRGDKSSYSSKQKRQARKIEKGYERRGVATAEAERRAWATVNKMTGGGKKAGSGRGKRVNKAPAEKGGRIGGAPGGAAVEIRTQGRADTGAAQTLTSPGGFRDAARQKTEDPALSHRVLPLAAGATPACRAGASSSATGSCSGSPSMPAVGGTPAPASAHPSTSPRSPRCDRHRW